MFSLMLVNPPCKINIGLHVVERRPDGYHNLETIFYPIPLRDNLDVKPLSEADFPVDEPPYRLTAGGAPIAGSSADNLVVKVYMSLREEFNLPPVTIDLYKHIPMGAGLGGGSSDAASMMKALNELFDLGLNPEEMERRMSAFGADCPFFVKARPVYATGIGNQFSPITLSLKGRYILLVKPNVFVSTKEAYAGIKPHPAAHDLCSAIHAPIEQWRETIINDFESSVFPTHPELAAIKQTLYDMGALYAAMSGSGSTIFGILNRPTPEARKVFKDCFVFEKQLIL